MTFTFKCYQNNFMINNLNILSFGGELKFLKTKLKIDWLLIDCFGSIITCMAFALLIELSRGIDLYLRHYSVTKTNTNPRSSDALIEKTIKRKRYLKSKI